MTVRFPAGTVSAVLPLMVLALLGSAGFGLAQTPGPPPAEPTAGARVYVPRIGQPGKDVVWVPTPPELVETMLDLARVTRDDFVIDLGSGDGRNIVAAARRGARGIGVEFNPDMVALSRKIAAENGVAQLATFVQGDMYEADIAKATVMAIYLLPVNMDRLLPKFQALTPGTRIVANTFGFTDWDPDERDRVQDTSCADWCEALLWIVPASVAGTWRLDDGAGNLALTQMHQVLYGSLETVGGTSAITGAKMRGYDITFSVGDRTYSGRVSGRTMQGTMSGPVGTGSWRATRDLSRAAQRCAWVVSYLAGAR